MCLAALLLEHSIQGRLLLIHPASGECLGKTAVGTIELAAGHPKLRPSSEDEQLQLNEHRQLALHNICWMCHKLVFSSKHKQ
jgi:hypothetical protein